MAKTKLSSREALIKVLSGDIADGKPMSVKALVDAALPLTNLKGKTPRATLAHVLYVNPKVFTKVGKGSFKLAPQAPAAVEPEPEALDAVLQGQVETPAAVEPKVEGQKRERGPRTRGKDQANA